MARSVWNRKFICLLVENIKAGKTKAEICDTLGLTQDALRMGMSRFKVQIDKIMNPKQKKVAVEEPLEVYTEEQEELPLVLPKLDEDVDFGTDYVTRGDGYEVNILRTNGIEPYCIYGEYKSSRGWRLGVWMRDGSYCDGLIHPVDLIKKPATPPAEIWVWCDSEGNHESFSSYEKALNWHHVKGGKIIPVSV